MAAAIDATGTDGDGQKDEQAAGDRANGLRDGGDCESDRRRR